MEGEGCRSNLISLGRANRPRAWASVDPYCSLACKKRQHKIINIERMSVLKRSATLPWTRGVACVERLERPSWSNLRGAARAERLPWSGPRGAPLVEWY